MAFDYNPKTATTISSSEEAARLDNAASFKNRWVSGFGALTSGASLNVTIQTGVAFVGGRQVGDGSDQVVALTASATNHVWLKDDGTLQTNTTGTPPAGEITKLYVFTTDGTGVTGTTDVRSDLVQLEAPFQAEVLTSDGDVVATSGEVHTKEVDLYNAGGTLKRKLRLNGSDEFEIVDESNNPANSDLVSPVDETDTDTTKDKAVSNFLAKGWQDHKNAAAPHTGHSLTADEGAANGIATLDASTHVVESVRRIQTTVTPAAAGQVQVTGSELLFHDGTAVRTVEETSRKGAASGYASLDSGGTVPSAELPQATTTAKGAVELADAAPPSLGTAAVGTSVEAAREDHVHAHGDLSAAGGTHHEFNQIAGDIDDTQHGSRGGGSLHANATGSVAGFMSAADKTTFDAATSAATASTLMKRDASGRAKVAAPSASTDIALKSTVDDHAAIEAAPVHGSTDAATASKLVHRDAAGRAKFADPSVASDAATKGYVDSALVTYAGVNAATTPSTGTIISQGVALASAVGSTPGAAAVPGMLSTPAVDPTVACGWLFNILGASASAGAPIPIGVPRGSKLYLKGTFKVLVDTRFSSLHAKLGIGVGFEVFSGMLDWVTSFLHETETGRDDNRVMAVVVDSSNNIQSYEVTGGLPGTATWVDSTFNAAPTNDIEFEVIVEVPSTADNTNDVKVTIRIEDDGGTMRTIFNESVLTTGSTTAGHSCNVGLGLNERGHVTNLTYKVEKAA